MSLSDYAEQKIIDWVSGKTTPPTVGTRYVSLHTGNPGETGASNEVTGGSYARVACTSALPTASTGSINNTAAITFPTATAAWGTITHFSIWDALTGGNCLASGSLGASKTINTADTFQFPIGLLTITVD